MPSIFPWTVRTYKRTSTISTIACSAIQRCDYHVSCTPSVDKSSADSDEQHTDYVESMDPSFPCSPTKELTALRQQVSQLQTDLSEANNTISKSVFCLKKY